jgi:hypothetical protein
MIRLGPGHKYCDLCSEKRDLRRKKLWARTHPQTKEQRENAVKRSQRKMSEARLYGMGVSAKHARGVTWYADCDPKLRWLARIAVPFDYAASKNHIYTARARGHTALRRESRGIRDEIAFTLRAALQRKTVPHNKLWIDILVQKPNHKGDAVNVIDLVCDAIEDALGLNDRWFCIRRLDWEIVKEDPQLYIGVGQESDEDCQVCSYCGQIKPLDAFHMDRHNERGRGRECKDCLTKRKR